MCRSCKTLVKSLFLVHLMMRFCQGKIVMNMRLMSDDTSDYTSDSSSSIEDDTTVWEEQ